MSKCACGFCDAETKSVFAPGHDQSVRTHLEQRVGGLLALRALVDAVEQYATGRLDTEELTKVIRATYGHRLGGP